MGREPFRNAERGDLARVHGIADVEGGDPAFLADRMNPPPANQCGHSARSALLGFCLGTDRHDMGDFRLVALGTGDSVKAAAISADEDRTVGHLFGREG